MQNWTDLYLELGEFLAAEVPAIRHIDLWHNQVNFLSDEHSFPSPALFLSFRILNTEDQGLKVQKVQLQVDTYLFYETFADTYQGAVNQGDALEFLKMLNDVHAVLHGTSGNNYSEMRRTGFSPVDTGGAGNLYLQNFTCSLVDYAAQKAYQDSTVGDISIENAKGPGVIETEPLYIIG